MTTVRLTDFLREKIASWLPQRQRDQSTKTHYIEDFPLLELALDHLNQALVMVDARGRVLIFNRRALEYTGVDRSDFQWPALARDVFRVQWERGEFGQDAHLMPENVRQFILTGKGTMPKSYVRRRPNGTVLEVRTEPLPNGGYVQTYSDITELMQAKEEAEAAARAKADFLAAMSHEIRTPLNGVLGIAALLDKSPLSDEQRNWVRIILQSGDTLVGLINDILDFSKFESGSVEFDPMPCNLRTLAQATIEVVESQARAKALDMNINIAASVPNWVLTDCRRLRQVLFNLIGNAVKFTDYGSVSLSLAKAEGGDGNRLRFEIRDTGIGIAPGAQQRLFRKFSQVDASINRRFGGTGLGLAICKKIVAAMDGTIGVESEEGVGSCFWFEVDAPECAAETALADDAKIAADKTAGRRILLVEDMPVNQLVARGMLASLGHAVFVANDGIEALEMLQHETYDAIVMDMQMPRMNGLDTTRVIRASGGKLAHVPIIAMTANAFHSDRSQCIAAGMNDFVGKPIELEELAAALRRVLQTDTRAAASRASTSRAPVLASLSRFIGPKGVACVLKEFRVESNRFLHELAAAVAQERIDIALSRLDQLEEAVASLGLVESLTEIAAIRRVLSEAQAPTEAALEHVRDVLLRGWQDAMSDLADLPPQAVPSPSSLRERAVTVHAA